MPFESRFTTSAGVRAGAKKPSQGSMTMFGKPDSTMVGTSGRNFERLGAVTASTRTLPPWRCGKSSLIGLTLTGIWPPIRSCSAGAPPL